jgi:hypothetical protein
VYCFIGYNCAISLRFMLLRPFCATTWPFV